MTSRLCSYCLTPCETNWLNTGNGTHHTDCWIERTKAKEEA